MRKLLLFTFTLAILSMLSLNTFAQWGKTVTVANDTELTKAMDDPAVESIILTPGYYDFFGQYINEGQKVIKGESGRSTCDYYIRTFTFCYLDPVNLDAYTTGENCPTDGIWTYSYDGGTTGFPGTAAFVDATDNSTSVTVSHPGRYIFRYTWSNGNYVEGDHYAVEVPGFAVSEIDPEYCLAEDLCVEFDVTITPNVGLPLQAQARPPYAFTYMVNAGVPALVIVTAADKVGDVYIKNLDEEFCALDCGTYTFTFEYIGSDGVYNALDQEWVFVECSDLEPIVRTTSIYDQPVEVSLSGDTEACVSDMVTLYTGYYVNCYHDDFSHELVSEGPGIATIVSNWDLGTHTVTVTECGLYTFSYTVDNPPCEPVTVMHTVYFYDIPVIEIMDDTEICGLTIELVASASINCKAHKLYEEGWYGSIGTITTTLDGTFVTVPECGTYSFTFFSYNGFEDCAAEKTVWIDFYEETEEVYLSGTEELCLPDQAFLYFGYDIPCVNEDTFFEELELHAMTAATEPVIEEGLGIATVTFSECGIYTFSYTVSNEPCDPVTVFHSVKVYELPVVVIPPVADVCEDENGEYHAILIADVSATCFEDEITGIWTKTAGPGLVAFDDDEAFTTGVQVSECGVYTFAFTAYLGPCGAVTETVTVNFYDTPEIIIEGPEVVCGREVELTAYGYADCPGGMILGEWTSWLGPVGAPEPTFLDLGTYTPTYAITVYECGVYTFTYTADNNGCENSGSFSVTFYDPPEPVIDGPEAGIYCDYATFTVEDLSDCDITGGIVSYTWWIVPFDAGIFIGGNTGEEVTVKWLQLGEATLWVEAFIPDLPVEECTGIASYTLTVDAPIFAGQVKYWNQFETFMPSPFPTKDYATYPHDYFYVQLGWGYYVGEDFIVVNDSLAVTKVENTIKEVYTGLDIDGNPTWDLTELSSYFEFDMEWFIEEFGGTQFTNGQLCEGFFLKIWDGGLHYYDMDGGFGINPPQAARHLGNNYTYNYWGGVNATDALGIQRMAATINVAGAPYNWAWIGENTWSPRYGYYSHSAADVNSSNPYMNGGITALDALTANYRAVGLIDVYPNSQVGIQYSPNFRVTGRMVDMLPEMTWNEPFNYPNVDDIPFVHSNESYLYFHPAWYHKYTSELISLSDKKFINIYYLALGDVNSSYVPPAPGFKAEVQNELAYVGEQIVRKGEVIEVPIRINSSAEVAALSMSLNYNTDLVEVLGVNYGSDHSMIDAENGIINIGWYGDPSIYAFGDAIVMIKVRVLADITADARPFEFAAEPEIADNTMNVVKAGFETTALNAVDAGLFATNYPNPFRTTTMISYSTPVDGNVTLVVYNKLGQVVETLVSATQVAGTYVVEFGRADLTPGVYFYKVVVEGQSETHTVTNSMILMQ